MSVYVFDRDGPLSRTLLRKFIRPGIIADTDAELHAMAGALGIAPSAAIASANFGLQYDIAARMVVEAVAAGAVLVRYDVAQIMLLRRKVTGQLGDPETINDFAMGYAERAFADVESMSGSMSGFLKVMVDSLMLEVGRHLAAQPTPITLRRMETAPADGTEILVQVRDEAWLTAKPEDRAKFESWRTARFLDGRWAFRRTDGHYWFLPVPPKLFGWVPAPQKSEVTR